MNTSAAREEKDISEAARSRHVLRSIGAVFVGFLFIVILSTVTDLVLVAIGVFPPLTDPARFTTGLWLLATAHRTLYSIIGCYLAARLAPNRPMMHALVLGGIGFLLATLGAVVMRGIGPAWYPIALVVLALPCAYIGGKLYRSSATKRAY